MVSEREHCVGGGYYCERERVILRRRDYYWRKVGTDKRVDKRNTRGRKITKGREVFEEER